MLRSLPFACVQLLNRRRNRSRDGTDLSDGICALLAIRLGSIIVGLILPLPANGRFKAMISCDPVAGLGPDASPLNGRLVDLTGHGSTNRDRASSGRARIQIP